MNFTFKGTLAHDTLYLDSLILAVSGMTGTIAGLEGQIMERVPLSFPFGTLYQAGKDKAIQSK